jgi:hypothetical protein
LSILANDSVVAVAKIEGVCIRLCWPAAQMGQSITQSCSSMRRVMENTNGFLQRSKPTSDVIIGRTQTVLQISGSEQIVVVGTYEVWKALCHDSQ